MSSDDKIISEHKMMLRQEAAERRASIPKSEAHALSQKIRERVLALPEVKLAGVVSCYCSFGSEVETHGLIEALAKQGKIVCLPVVDESRTSMTMYAFKSFADLKISEFGFPEPVPSTHQKVDAQEIDVVIAPGLAFDEKCHRLGFGMAFYDRYLAGMPKPVPIIALAFERQVFPRIPVTKRDIVVDKIVTENRVIERKR